MSLHLTRRGALLGLGSAISLGGTSLALAQAPTDRRFVVVLLRGALDGMAAVAPYGDAGFAALRPGVAQPGAPDGLLDLGGFYGLHPALTGLHGLYVAGQMLPVHAVAGPYRSRSHFEAQDYLESGADQRLTSGWLNRVALALHATGTGTALAVGSGVPLLLRGAAPAATWLPHGATGPQADLYRSIAALNAPDRVLGPAVAEGLRDRGFSDAVLAGTQQPRNRFTFPALAGRCWPPRTGRGWQRWRLAAGTPTPTRPAGSRRHCRRWMRRCWPCRPGWDRSGHARPSWW